MLRVPLEGPRFSSMPPVAGGVTRAPGRLERMPGVPTRQHRTETAKPRRKVNANRPPNFRSDAMRSLAKGRER